MVLNSVFCSCGLDRYIYQFSSMYVQVVGAVKYCRGHYRAPNLKKKKERKKEKKCKLTFILKQTIFHVFKEQNRSHFQHL